MNKKSLALIIFLVVIVAGYGLFYAAVTTVLMPQDLKEFQTQLNEFPQVSASNDTAIAEMEASAALIESTSALQYTSPSQRTAMATQMRDANGFIPPGLNQNFTSYNEYMGYKALAYSLVFKGELSSDLNNISASYNTLSNISNQIQSLTEKMANDFENGDNQAYADDLRDMADLLKTYESEMASLKLHLQEVVQQLGG